MPTYRVLNGLNYGDTRREPGDLADDIPVQSVKWLLQQGHIEAVEESPQEVKRGPSRE